MIGNPAPDYTKMKYWVEIANSDSEKELEFRRPDGCAYAILVQKTTNIVKSWRFTSERNQCDREIYAPSV